ncbi:MAG: hypothetical protein ACE5GJ_09305 [Gemmatimonadota bacterium]
MKLVFLMYLEEDDKRIVKLLEEHHVVAWSRMSMEGHGSGMRGWYGEVAPYASRLIFTVLREDKARELLEAVRVCVDCEDPQHPIHAMMVAVEEMADSGTAGS